MADDHAEKEDRMALTMTKREREAFLAGVHVGMISIAEEGRGPLTVPIWYTYAPGGELQLITGRHSRKGRLLTQAGRCSLCVHTESPPYRYVSVEGPITARRRAIASASRRVRGKPTTSCSACGRSAG